MGADAFGRAAPAPGSIAAEGQGAAVAETHLTDKQRLTRRRLGQRDGLRLRLAEARHAVQLGKLLPNGGIGRRVLGQARDVVLQSRGRWLHLQLAVHLADGVQTDREKLGDVGIVPVAVAEAGRRE